MRGIRLGLHVAGLYVEPDPIGLAGGMNPYAYAGNDPVNMVDPSGLLTAMTDPAMSASYGHQMDAAMFDSAMRNMQPMSDSQLGNVSGQGVPFLGLLGAVGRTAVATSSSGTSSVGLAVNATSTAAAVGTFASSVGSDSTRNNQSSRMNLFRAVGPAELNSLIANKGRFVNPDGIEGKYFATSHWGARSYATQAETAYGDPPYSIVMTTIPRSDIVPSMVPPHGVDQGIGTVVVPTFKLPRLSPAIILERARQNDQ